MSECDFVPRLRHATRNVLQYNPTVLPDQAAGADEGTLFYQIAAEVGEIADQLFSDDMAARTRFVSEVIGLGQIAVQEQAGQ